MATYLQNQNLINKQLVKKEAELLAVTISNFKDRLDSIRADLMRTIEQYSNADGTLNVDELKRFNRLESLRAGVNAKINDAIDKTSTNINKLIESQYATTYYGYTWATEQATKAGIEFGTIDKATLSKLLDNRFTTAAITDMANQAKQKIGEIFSIGFLEGKGARDIAIQVGEVVGISARRALTIIRTESSRSIETAKVENFKDVNSQGIKTRLQYVAVLDKRTRRQSALMDGDYSNDEGKFKYPDGRYYYQGYTGHPEWDINDRCTTIQVIEDFEPQVRRDGTGVIENATFNEWATQNDLKESIYGEQYDFI